MGNIQLSEATEKIVSARTVRRSLAELGYEYKVKLKKPLLTLAHKNVRLLWCQERQDWTWKE